MNVAAGLDPKVLSTLTARLCLKGFQLAVIDDDRGEPCFVVSKYNLTKQLNSLDALLDFMHRAGA